MPALKCDILIEQGATFQREFTVTDKGKDIPNFEDFDSRAMLRNNAGTLAATFTVSITGPRTVLITLSATDSALLPASTGYTHKYDVEVEGGGIVYRIAQGRATISAEQTKET